MSIWPFRKAAKPDPTASLAALQAGDAALASAKRLDARVDVTVAASRAVLERNHVAAHVAAALRGAS